MFAIAVVFATLLLLSGIVQIGFVGKFHRFVNQKRRPALEPNWTPQATVVLCVRGYDSCLDACLSGLLQQDYPDYTVEVVVDSESDPAWPALVKWQRSVGEGRMRISPLRNRLKTCSLKCSSLVQAITDLSSTVEIVVLIDADVTPLSNWLRELVKPLSDPTVGLATGNRWFEPKPGMWGTNVRSCWNAGAVVQMLNFEIPWGGSLAMRRADIESHRVVDNWSQSFNDDVILGDLFYNAGKRIHRVPELLMINREDVRLDQLWGWVLRQCMHLRHYHRSWKQIGSFNIFVSLATVAHLVLLPILAAFGQFAAAGTLLIGLAGYYLTIVALCLWIDSIAQNILRRQQQAVSRMGWCPFWILPFTHAVYCFSSIAALFKRKVQWRGVWYHIHAPLRVEVLKDTPFEMASSASTASIL